MKKLHLICNSHIDPVWQWDWNEGITATLATFWQAVRFSEEYDYIFCHNESILFEWIELYDRTLFEEITRLVKAGKWHIMGGWYIQPDCNIPAGESFVRVIKLGREYFSEKFGVKPTVALNFDSFGHSKGLVQILKKCGYNGYMFCRPMKHEQKEDLREFIWEGVDGSRIIAARAQDDCIYCSEYGKLPESIERKSSNYADMEQGVALWGVGNHGGVNSRFDLDYVTELVKTDSSVFHSTPENYFAQINPQKTVGYSLQPLLKGSYSSMSNIKRAICRLETKLYSTEKLCSVASLRGVFEYNSQVFRKAEKVLGQLLFHDICAGTCCEDGELSSLQKANGAMAELEDESCRAILAIAKNHKAAIPFEFPIFAFNYQPYKRKTLMEAEIFILEPLISDTEEYEVKVRYNGEYIPSQCIKELGNINFDRKKRIGFIAELEGLDLTRFDFEVEKVNKTVKPEYNGGDILFTDSIKTVIINGKTGLLNSFVLNGKQLLKGDAFKPIMVETTPNPWAHGYDKICSNFMDFKLSDCSKGIFKGMKCINIVEQGDVLTRVESLYELESSFVRVTYTIPKELPYVDCKIDAFWNEQNSGLVLQIPSAIDGDFTTQLAYGAEQFPKDGTDHPTLRYTALVRDDKALAIYNDGVYNTFCENNTLNFLLFNGAAYCAHLVDNRPIIKDKSRFVPYIEQGKHSFNFRISYENASELENRADEFIESPYILNIYPHGNGQNPQEIVSIDNPAVALKAFYSENSKYVLRLFNGGAKNQKATLKVDKSSVSADFGKYEIKTFVYDGEKIVERYEIV
ncbi:MAG: hypothetical protein MJ080_05095 [Clostridia bacterium]|nr:hypothetical protein [Clostridia bacterium]